MSRIVRGGLIQATTPMAGDAEPQKIKKAMIDKHLPMVDEAGKKGVQILCLQEIFCGPYFCPSQDIKWCDTAEAIPGPTCELMAKYAKKYNMVIIVPIYEREMAGVYYNTAAVIDADGTLLGKYRKNHIPHTNQFWEKFFFKPGNLGYPTFQTKYAKIGVYICYDRHFPEGARLLGLHGAEIVRGEPAPGEGALAGLDGDAVQLDRALERLEREGHQALLPGIAQHEQVGGDRVTKDRRGEAGAVDERRGVVARGVADRLHHRLGAEIHVAVHDEGRDRLDVAVDDGLGHALLDA